MKSVYLSPSTQEKNIGYGNYGTEEYRANQIADITEKILKEYGITVYRNKPEMTLTQVVTDSNNKNPIIHFAIHTNANAGKSRGCEVFCHKSTGEGHRLAKEIYTKISNLTPSSDRGIKQGHNFYGQGKHMYELYSTNSPAALVEVAFHDNKDDSEWIIENIEKIGIELAKGILVYFGITYKEKAEKNIKYRIIAGTYSNKNNAENQIKTLKNAGFDCFIEELK